MSIQSRTPRTSWPTLRTAVGLLGWAALTWVSMHFLLAWFAFSLSVAESTPAVLPASLEAWRRTASIALANSFLTQIFAGLALSSGLQPAGPPVSRKLRFLLVQAVGFLANLGGFAVALTTGGLFIDPMVERTVRQIAQSIVRLVWQ